MSALETSCGSIDSERLHRCYRIKFSILFPILANYNGLGDAPSKQTPESVHTHTNVRPYLAFRLLQPFGAGACGCANRHTDHDTLVAIDRI